MINKELKRLNRRELVDIIYALKKNEERLQTELLILQNEVQDKRIRMSKAGSIAEASISITNLFATAQTTADIYLKEIADMKENWEKEYARRMEEANEKASQILAEAEKEAAELKAKYQVEYKTWLQLHAGVKFIDEGDKIEPLEDVEND